MNANVSRRRFAMAVATALAGGAAHADPPLWQAHVYYPVGSIVSYRGRQYTASVSQIDFRGSGWDPTHSKLWTELAPPRDRWFNLRGTWFVRAHTEARCALVWNPTNIYTTGGVASLDGINYRANWWTQGESPPAHSGAGGGQPWTSVSRCDGRT